MLASCGSDTRKTHILFHFNSQRSCKMTSANFTQHACVYRASRSVMLCTKRDERRKRSNSGESGLFWKERRLLLLGRQFVFPPQSMNHVWPTPHFPIICHHCNVWPKSQISGCPIEQLYILECAFVLWDGRTQSVIEQQLTGCWPEWVCVMEKDEKIGISAKMTRVML